MTTTKKKTTPKKKKKPTTKPLPKYAMFDEIIYSDTDITDLEELLDIYQGTIHSIEYSNKTFHYGIQGRKQNGYARSSYLTPYGDCYQIQPYSSSYEELEEKDILGLAKDSADVINKVFDTRIKEIEKERAKTLKQFKTKK